MVWRFVAKKQLGAALTGSPLAAVERDDQVIARAGRRDVQQPRVLSGRVLLLKIRKSFRRSELEAAVRCLAPDANRDFARRPITRPS